MLNEDKKKRRVYRFNSKMPLINIFMFYVFTSCLLSVVVQLVGNMFFNSKMQRDLKVEFQIRHIQSTRIQCQHRIWGL